MPAPLAIVLPVRFTEAIRAAERRKVALPDDYYGTLQAGARSEAFTISGLASIAQLTAALEALNEGLRQGMTFAEWKAKALGEGWGLTGPQLALVMRAHTQTAYMRGVYEQAERMKDRRPYLLYSAINDNRTRPAHLAMDGIIRPIDDAFWDTHFPPCGFNCRCGVVSLTEGQARDRGGPTQHIPIEARADPGWGFRPTREATALQELVHRRALDLPAALQDEVLVWHEGIKAERLPERVRAYLGPLAPRLEAEVLSFVRDMQGLIADFEAMALRAYTMDEFYGAMNAYLRGQSDGSFDLMATISAAVSAAAKLPAFEGRVYRGIFQQGLADPARFAEAHVPGAVVEYQAFTSASYGVERAFRGDVVYRIFSRTGRVVEDVSFHGHESEVLFLPQTQFRVISAVRRNGNLLLELEEVATRVSVPDSNKFDDPYDRALRGEPADKLVSESLQALMNDQAKADPAAMERFRREHDGMTPVQRALSLFPSAAVELEQDFPHLAPPKKAL